MSGSFEVDEFELFKARALGGGIAPVQSLPSTPPGTPDRIHEDEEDVFEDREGSSSPSGSTGSGHHPHRHHSHHHHHRQSRKRVSGRREAGPGAVQTQLSQDSQEGEASKEGRCVLRMPSVTVDPPTPCEEKHLALGSTSPSLPKADHGLQRSHSCRVRRSPRHQNAQEPTHYTWDDYPSSDSHQRLLDHDAEGYQPKSAFNRQRNRTMPVKRNQNARRQSAALNDPYASFNKDMASISPSDLSQGPGGECRIYRVRSFTTHGSGVVNRGDSFKIKSRSHRSHEGGGSFRNKRSHSRCSALDQSAEGSSDKQAVPEKNIDMLEVKAASEMNGAITPAHSSNIPTIAIDDVLEDKDIEGAVGGQSDELAPNPPGQMNGSDVNECQGNVVIDDPGGQGAADGDEEDEEEDAQIHRVLVLGSQGVGKTTLTQQLLTSEYLANKETGPDEETGDQIVSVMLDDVESMVLFLDSRGGEPVKDRDDVDAFVVVYSVTDRSSFSYAQACLQDICGKGKICRRAVILVANKQESVRNRVVSEDDGRNLATKRRCKFIEVSALLDHKVDDLLVGIIRQIRIKKKLAEQCEDRDARVSNTGCLQRAAFGLFRKLFHRTQHGISRSCDNLLV